MKQLFLIGLLLFLGHISGMTQISEEDCYDINSSCDTLYIDLNEMTLSKRIIDNKLFGCDCTYGIRIKNLTSHDSTFLYLPSKAHYLIIDNYKKDMSIEGRINSSGMFSDTVWLKRDGSVIQRSIYRCFIITDEQNGEAYYWMNDGPNPYGVWQYFRKDGSLKKQVKYYYQVTDNNIIFLKSISRISKTNEVKCVKEKTLDEIIR